MKKVTLLASVAALALTVGATGAQAASGHHSSWGYEGDVGPSHWGHLDEAYAACDMGTQQSPIDVSTKAAIPAELADVAPNWSPTPLDVVNNGHTIQVNAAEGSSVEVNGKTYNLAQFHFHHPSEHVVDGTPYPMEVHFVHMAPDGKSAAVIGVFFEEGAANPAIEAIWNVMPHHEGEVSNDATVDPNALLPSDLTYYNYAGSLTTPPCSEIIDWVVMKQPITVSAEQIAAFAELFPMNARPVQELNRRKVVLED